MQQTILALLGITIGVASVVCMISVGESAKEKTVESIKAMGTDILTGTTERNFSAGRVLDKDILKESDVGKMSRENRFIIASAPRMDSFLPVRSKDNSINLNVFGINGNFNFINKLKIKFGRKITNFDMDKNFCVLGEEVAEQLFGKVSKQLLGKEIYLNRDKFKILGIYQKAKYVTFAENFNESVFIPIKRAEVLFKTKQISSFKAKIQDNYSAEKAKAKLQDFFFNRLQLPVNIQTQEMLIRQAEEQTKTSTNVLIATAAISLIVGGIGVMNLMLVSIKERKREIGIRRSCGANKFHIEVQFLAEALILALIGGIIGVMLGIISSFTVAFYADWKAIIPISSIFLSFTVSLLIGVVFGYFPAKKAANMEIINALRMD